MENHMRPPGKTTIAPEVLINIARLSALSVPGVNRLGLASGDVNRIFKGVTNEGVRITVENDVVSADLFVIMNKDVNVRDVSRAIQAHVTRAISEMVGMEVGKINVHVEDIEYSIPEDQA